MLALIQQINTRDFFLIKVSLYLLPHQFHPTELNGK